MSIIYLNILLIFLNIYSSVDCLNSIEINEVINNKTSLRYDVYEIWKNRTSILKVHHDHSKTLDCFGFGETVAGLLNWYFTKKPNSASNIDVQFYLTSTRKRSRCLVLCGDQFGLEWTDFKPERKTIIIVHGFLSSHNEEWITEMENAFLNWEDVNVVTVDWSAHGNTWNYYRASVNGKIVAGEIVKFLSHVVNATVAGRSKEPNWGPIHMVGHSLGAHICGRVASEFKKLNTKWEVERITGLDPAQPCFVNAAYSLDQSDAKFVDIIHTNGKLWSHFGLGLPDPIGHVDFYPNGGRSQPGCLRIKNSWVTSAIGIGTDAIQQAVCSHGRSYIYLTESIKAATLNKKNCTFLGYTWDRSYRQAVKIINERMNVDKNNCNEMGIRADLYTNRGTFFVMTSSVDPYCDVSTSNIKEYAKQLGADFTDESED